MQSALISSAVVKQQKQLKQRRGRVSRCCNKGVTRAVNLCPQLWAVAAESLDVCQVTPSLPACTQVHPAHAAGWHSREIQIWKYTMHCALCIVHCALCTGVEKSQTSIQQVGTEEIHLKIGKRKTSPCSSLAQQRNPNLTKSTNAKIWLFNSHGCETAVTKCKKIFHPHLLHRDQKLRW